MSGTRVRVPVWVVYLGFGAVIALIVWFFGQPASGPFAGERAPSFTVTALATGESVSLESLSGKPVFINFWATWCEPCLEEMPAIQAVYEQNPDAFHVVAVTDEPEATVRRYLEDFDYTFPIYLDRRGEMANAYRVTAMPTSVFINRSGIVVARHVGQMSRAQIEEYVGRIR